MVYNDCYDFIHTNFHKLGQIIESTWTMRPFLAVIHLIHTDIAVSINLVIFFILQLSWTSDLTCHTFAYCRMSIFFICSFKFCFLRFGIRSDNKPSRSPQRSHISSGTRVDMATFSSVFLLRLSLYVILSLKIPIKCMSERKRRKRN